MKRRHTLAEEDAVFETGFVQQLGEGGRPMTADDPTTVKLVPTGHGVGDIDYEPPPPTRTPMEKVQDEILEQAEDATIAAQRGVTDALAWMDVITDLPKELRHTLSALLADLQVLIHEERRLRG